MSTRTLRLNTDQSWLVFNGLGEELARAEAMAAIYFGGVDRHEAARYVARMHECHKLRARLFPSAFRLRVKS